jgi:cobalt/nickel transport system permease protein
MGHVVGADRQAWRGIAPEHAEGFVRRIDPRVRILATVVFGIAVVALDDLMALVAALALAAAFTVLARLPARQTLLRMAAMDGFIVLILVMLPFTVPGDAFVEIAGFRATWQGSVAAVQIALKANAVVLASMALAGSMESVTFGHALHRLRVPENLVHLLLFTVRYTEVLHREYLRLRTAMKARGFRPRNSRHTYKSFGYLIGMMLVRALERSERILDAMKCRGFSGRIPVMHEFRLRTRDLLFGGAVGLSLVALHVVESLRVATY